MVDMPELFTVGYTSFTLPQMLEVISDYGIDVVVDVRSNPFSAHYPDYNKNIFESVLRKHKISYHNYAEEFGAQQTDIKYYSKDGYLDFELFAKSEPFLKGFARIDESVKSGDSVMLMCAEKDPAQCHRAVMISKVFANNGYDVKHLLQDGTIKSQSDIETQLLDKYFPNRMQQSIFEDDVSEKELIARAYQRRNSEIGYRIEDAKGEPFYNRLYEENGGAVLHHSS
jgi:uncharacterized protein (DUF488 family)